MEITSSIEKLLDLARLIPDLGRLLRVLNPKTALFFLAFLPQFTDPSAVLPIWTQLLLLGTIVNVMFSSADLVCVLLAGAAVERLRRSSRAQRIARCAGGAILIGLGANLALHRQ